MTHWSGDGLKQQREWLFGNAPITERVSFAGVADSSMTVEAGGILELLGEISQDLILRPGSRAVLLGSVLGNVWNHGGELTVYGTVGKIVHRVAGLTIIDPGAVIGGGVW